LKTTEKAGANQEILAEFQENQKRLTDENGSTPLRQ
jgi:hypothetical protein